MSITCERETNKRFLINIFEVNNRKLKVVVVSLDVCVWPVMEWLANIHIEGIDPYIHSFISESIVLRKSEMSTSIGSLLKPTINLRNNWLMNRCLNWVLE